MTIICQFFGLQKENLTNLQFLSKVFISLHSKFNFNLQNINVNSSQYFARKGLFVNWENIIILPLIPSMYMLHHKCNCIKLWKKKSKIIKIIKSLKHFLPKKNYSKRGHDLLFFKGILIFEGELFVVALKHKAKS